MDKHTFPGMRKFCYTDLLDFTDFQGIGRDPLYKRYSNIRNVLKRYIPENYRDFLAVPEYNSDEGNISWYLPDWNEHPVKLTNLTGDEREKYERIKKENIRRYRDAVNAAAEEDLQILAGILVGMENDDNIYCCDNNVYVVAWGMRPNTGLHNVKGSVIVEVPDFVKTYKISFDAGEHGNLSSKLNRTISRKEGEKLLLSDFPSVNADDGWSFSGWSPTPSEIEIKSDLNFRAEYLKENREEVSADETESEDVEDHLYTCRFRPGMHGVINGNECVTKAENSKLDKSEIPNVKPNSGYEFIGWDISPMGMLINGDMVFTALYKREPWYRRFWRWLTESGFLKWLLWLLAILFIIWLLFLLLDGCHGCSRKEVNGITPIDTVAGENGKRIDNNGYIRPVTTEDGKLPDENSIVAPAMGEGGVNPPIIERPGVPDVIANRLFLFMENENDNIDALARDFKKAYPDEKYSIIGYDKEIKLLVIQIPEAERDQIRQTINSKIPNHKFIVFDEEVYKNNGTLNDHPSSPGWHLKAIHLKEGWKYTQGSPNVKIAVVDDGIDAGHPMFKGRIVDAYNVFTQNNSLSIGVGHGTHTAGLAAGCADFYNKGAAGVAPKCSLMPIQVLDNGLCPLSALVAGVMYAVHHDADVVNVSIGPSFKGLNQLPIDEQNQISRQQFKNVEMLWSRVCKLATRKNTILVFAAGNDDILSSIPPENRTEAAITVTAVDSRLYPTEFTNYGPCSDISAPGKDIYSSYPRGGFKSFDGTSMAAPIVTGTIALMKSLKKDLTIAQARNVLYKTGADVYGFIPPMVLVDKVLQGVKRGDFSTPKERKTRSAPGFENSAGSGNPAVPSPPDVDAPPVETGGTDYDAIRRKINEYKEKISELEKLLPRK